jgi:hypothetical protein
VLYNRAKPANNDTWMVAEVAGLRPPRLGSEDTEIEATSAVRPKHLVEATLRPEHHPRPPVQLTFLQHRQVFIKCRDQQSTPIQQKPVGCQASSLPEAVAVELMRGTCRSSGAPPSGFQQEHSEPKSCDDVGERKRAHMFQSQPVMVVLLRMLPQVNVMHP